LLAVLLELHLAQHCEICLLTMVCFFDRLLTKVKSEEDLQQRLLAAEAQVNELRTRLNESNNKLKRVDDENAVSLLKTLSPVVCTMNLLVPFEYLVSYEMFFANIVSQHNMIAFCATV